VVWCGGPWWGDQTTVSDVAPVLVSTAAALLGGWFRLVVVWIVGRVGRGG